MIISQLLAVAQSQLKVIGHPKSNYGFFIWQCDHPDARYYDFKVNKEVISQADTTYVNEYRVEVWNKNYVKIPDVFVHNWNDDNRYQLQLNALDENHAPLPDQEFETTEGGPTGEKGCNWDCNSNEWAFRIQQYVNNGTYNYRVTTALNAEDDELNMQVPYFRYFSTSHFNQYIGLNQIVDYYLGDPNWHNYSYWEDFITQNRHSSGPWNPIATQMVIQSQTPPYYGGYCDYLGHHIHSPQVFGIRKGYGPVWEFGSTWQHTDLSADYCDAGLGADLQSMMQFLNNEIADLPTPLTCPPLMGSGSCQVPTGSGPGGGPPLDDNNLKDVIKMYKLSQLGSGISGSLKDEVIQIDANNWLTVVSDVFDHDGTGTDGEKFAAILSDARHLSIVDFNGNINIMVQGHAEEFFDQHGTPVFPALHFSEGLYSISVQREDAKLYYFFFEVVESFQLDFQLKNYLDALLYPNPHSTPEVFANITTTAALDVRYELYDGQGTMLFVKMMSLAKNHSGSHKFEPDVHVPNGFLYHKFSFDDGSYKT